MTNKEFIRGMFC